MGETVTNKKLAQIYKDRSGTMAESTKAELGEKSDQFISDCLRVYDKLLVDDYINKKLDNLERKFGLESCLNNLAKLRLIVEKTNNLADRQWVVAWIEDALTAGGNPPLLTNDAVMASDLVLSLPSSSTKTPHPPPPLLIRLFASSHIQHKFSSSSSSSSWSSFHNLILQFP